MGIGKLARLFLAATPLLSGCANFWQAPASSTTTTGVFYVLNQSAGQIAGYSIASSALTAVTGSPYSLGATPYAIAISPNGKFLYASTLTGIFLYTINTSTGALTLANSSAAISSDYATAMKVDSTNSWLVIAGPGTSGVVLNAIPISSTTGLSTVSTATPKQSTVISGTTSSTSVNQLAISPDNTHVFLALGTAGTIVDPFTAGNTAPLSTTLTSIPVKNTGGSALSVAVDTSDRVFYVGETLGDTAGTAGGLRVFNYASLSTSPIAVTEVTGSPYESGGLAPNAILPGATYTYVANGAGSGNVGNVAEFTMVVTGTVYSLTTGATIAAGTNPVGLVIENTKTNLIAVDSGASPDVQVFTMSSGTLTAAFTGTAGSGTVWASAIVAAP